MEIVKEIMKTLYTFEAIKKVQVPKEVKRKEGDKEIVEKTMEEQSVPIKVLIRKPSRSLLEDGELFFSVKVSEGIQAGLLTRAQLSKRLLNDGGILSEPEKQEYMELFTKLFQAQDEFQRLSLKEDKLKTEDDKKKVLDLTTSITTVRKKLQEFEMAQATLFDHTAESYARTKAILWWLVNLSYIQSPTDAEPKFLFGDGDYKARMDVYESFDENEDVFHYGLAQKLGFYITAWYAGAANKPEEFKTIDEQIGL